MAQTPDFVPDDFLFGPLSQEDKDRQDAYDARVRDAALRIIAEQRAEFATLAPEATGHRHSIRAVIRAEIRRAAAHGATADQIRAALAAPVPAVELIARCAPIGHPHHRGPRVQVWRVDSQGHEIEALQYIEQLNYASTTAENMLAAAGYTLVGVWRPEAEPGTIEWLPLRCDARGFLRRMHRLYSPAGAGNVTDPDAAAVVRDVLAALLLPGTHAEDPANIRAALHDHLTAARAGASAPARPGRIDPQVSAHVADILASILRTLETEFAPHL